MSPYAMLLVPSWGTQYPTTLPPHLGMMVSQRRAYSSNPAVLNGSIWYRMNTVIAISASAGTLPRRGMMLRVLGCASPAFGRGAGRPVRQARRTRSQSRHSTAHPDPPGTDAASRPNTRITARRPRSVSRSERSRGCRTTQALARKRSPRCIPRLPAR